MSNQSHDRANWEDRKEEYLRANEQHQAILDIADSLKHIERHLADISYALSDGAPTHERPVRGTHQAQAVYNPQPEEERLTDRQLRAITSIASSLGMNANDLDAYCQAKMDRLPARLTPAQASLFIDVLRASEGYQPPKYNDARAYSYAEANHNDGDQALGSELAPTEIDIPF